MIWSFSAFMNIDIKWNVVCKFLCQLLFRDKNIILIQQQHKQESTKKQVCSSCYYLLYLISHLIWLISFLKCRIIDTMTFFISNEGYLHSCNCDTFLAVKSLNCTLVADLWTVFAITNEMIYKRIEKALPGFQI